MPTPAHLLSLATAVPPHVLMQRDVAGAAAALFSGRYDEFDRLSKVFDTTGILKRHAVRPMEWYMQPRGWPERTAAYLDGARDLFIEAAGRALAKAGLEARDVDTVVTVSSTGIATPSLEARVFGRMGFRPDIMRVPVFGLGCAGGVSGLSIAARLAEQRPGSVVLLVAVELCTLAFRLDELTKANIVATALFGDGAAACLLRAGEMGLALVEGAGEHTWADTLDIMGWNVDPLGFGVIFARSIPPFIDENLRPALVELLDRLGLGLSDVGRFVCHAGGTKVIAALERALSLDQGSLDHEREVLADHGNMSSPTVLFVLDRVLRSGLPERSLLNALGPGFTASCHCPLIIVLHAAWLAGLWLFAWNVSPNVPLLVLFGVLQIVRIWVLASLGGRWTTRILVLPGRRLVQTGPYRFLRHPNYAVVAAEIAVLPLAFGFVWYALVFSALNAAVLAVRIRAENEALARYGGNPAG